jgi:hypothetical protein
MSTTQFIKSPFTFVSANIAQSAAEAPPNLSLIVVSKRGTIDENELGVLDSDINLYRPFQIPFTAMGSGADLLSYLSGLGATVTMGVSNTINLVAPNSTTVSGGTVTLTWTSEPDGWDEISGISISGTLSQTQPGPTTATGAIQSVGLGTTYTITLSGVTGTFNTTNVVTLSYVNNSINIPDGRQTEQFALDLYYAVQAMNIQNTVNLTTGTPNLYCTIVSDRDSAFAPNSTDVSLVAPDTVTVNGDGTVSLFWNTLPDGWIYVPQTALGGTTFTQGAAYVATEDEDPIELEDSSGSLQTESVIATGTFVQQLAPQYTPTGAGYGVLLSNVTGAFDTDQEVDMVLDDTQNVFDLLGNNYYRYMSVNPAITTATDFNTTYEAFQEYILMTWSEQASGKRLFGTAGVFAADPTQPYTQLNTLVQPNSYYFRPIDYYYPVRLGNVYGSAGQIAASIAGALSCNLPPYPLMNNVVLNGLFVSSDSSTYIDTGPFSTAEQLADIGWNAIGVNRSGQPFMVIPITSAITLPNSSVTDQEFYDSHVWDVIPEIKSRIWDALNAEQFQNRLITPQFLKDQENAIFAVLVQAQSEQMIFNVAQWKQQIVVTLNPVNPHQTLASCVVQITPAYTGTVVNINVVSALITPPGTQA